MFGVRGGTGDPPDSSDGVFDKNKLPPSSDTSVIGELRVLRYYLTTEIKDRARNKYRNI